VTARQGRPGVRAQRHSSRSKGSSGPSSSGPYSRSTRVRRQGDVGGRVERSVAGCGRSDSTRGRCRPDPSGSSTRAAGWRSPARGSGRRRRNGGRTPAGSRRTQQEVAADPLQRAPAKPQRFHQRVASSPGGAAGAPSSATRTRRRRPGSPAIRSGAARPGARERGAAPEPVLSFSSGVRSYSGLKRGGAGVCGMWCMWLPLWRCMVSGDAVSRMWCHGAADWHHRSLCRSKASVRTWPQDGAHEGLRGAP